MAVNSQPMTSVEHAQRLERLASKLKRIGLVLLAVVAICAVLLWILWHNGIAYRVIRWLIPITGVMFGILIMCGAVFLCIIVMAIQNGRNGNSLQITAQQSQKNSSLALIVIGVFITVLCIICLTRIVPIIIGFPAPDEMFSPQMEERANILFSCAAGVILGGIGGCVLGMHEVVSRWKESLSQQPKDHL